MDHKISSIKSGMNDDGYVLVLALVMLAFLSIIGVAALNTTDVEMQIAANDKLEKEIFYGTESGCRRGGQWIRNIQTSQVEDYADDTLIDAYIAAASFDSSLQVRQVDEDDEANLGDDDYRVKYRYDIKESETVGGTRLDCQPIEGNNPNMLECYYDVSCATTTGLGGSRAIDIRIDKPTDFN